MELSDKGCQRPCQPAEEVEGDAAVGCMLLLMVSLLLFVAMVDVCSDAASDIIRAAKCEAYAPAIEAGDGAE